MIKHFLSSVIIFCTIITANKAISCTCSVEEPELVTEKVAPNEAILLSGILDRYDSVEYDVISSTTQKKYQIKVTKFGSDKYSWNALIQPEKNWRKGDRLTVTMKDWRDSQENGQTHPYNNETRTILQDNIKVHQYLRRKNTWNVRVKYRLDRKPPRIEVEQLTEDNIHGNIDTQSCFMRYGVHTKLKSISERGGGNHVVLFYAYLFPRNLDLNEIKPSNIFPPNTHERYLKKRDHSVPNAILSYASSCKSHEQPDSEKVLSLGVLGCYRTPKTLAPVGENVCMIIFPVDLAGNIGRPQMAGCVTMSERDLGQLSEDDL